MSEERTEDESAQERLKRALVKTVEGAITLVEATSLVSALLTPPHTPHYDGQVESYVGMQEEAKARAAQGERRERRREEEREGVTGVDATAAAPYIEEGKNSYNPQRQEDSMASHKTFDPNAFARSVAAKRAGTPSRSGYSTGSSSGFRISNLQLRSGQSLMGKTATMRAAAQDLRNYGKYLHDLSENADNLLRQAANHIRDDSYSGVYQHWLNIQRELEAFQQQLKRDIEYLERKADETDAAKGG